MKKYILAVIFTILCVILNVGCNNLTEAAAPVTASDGILSVRMDGRASVGQENNAVESAKKRAVFKVLSHMTRPDNDPNSTFASLIENYSKYVVSAKLENKKEVNNSIQVIMNVEVNLDLLKEDLQDTVADEQNEQIELTSTLMIRSAGSSNPSWMDEEVVTAFNKRFGEVGFIPEYDSEVNKKIAATRHLAFSNYELEMMKSIMSNEVMVTVAIIGEIRINSVERNVTGNGYYSKAAAVLKSYDTVNQRVIGTFEEDYTMLANTTEEAERLVIQKAAMDSAESMAQQTLKYWRDIKITN